MHCNIYVAMHSFCSFPYFIVLDVTDILNGLTQAKIIKKSVIYFSLLIWPYDVNMYID